MNKNGKNFTEENGCSHKNIKQEGGFFVCQDCGLIEKDQIAFERTPIPEFYSNSQLEYERKIRVSDSKAIQDPETRRRYEQIKTLNKWLEEESAQTLDHAKVIPVESFGDIVVSWAKIGGGKITRILKQEYSNAKAFIGIDTRNDDIIIYSNFFNCREFAREFGGGGHKERAGFKYPQIFQKKHS